MGKSRKGESDLKVKVAEVLRGAKSRVIELDKVKDSVFELEHLYTTKNEAARDYTSAVKRIAGKAGISASALSHYIASRATGKIAERREYTEQLQLLFTEIA